MLFIDKVFKILKKNADSEIIIPSAVAKRLKEEAYATRTEDEKKDWHMSQVRSQAVRQRKKNPVGVDNG